MSAVSKNHIVVEVDNETDVYLIAGRPSPYPGYVFVSSKQQEDGTWKVFFVREEAAEHAYREMLTKAARKLN